MGNDMKRFLSLAAAILFVGGSAFGDDKTTTQPFDDATFIKMAASGGMHEVELGKLAASQAHRDDVKKFGEKMVTDHSAMNESLKKVAASMNVNPPDKMNDEHQKEVDKFKDLKGAEFDKAYIKHMVEDHEKDVKEFTKASKEAKDANLRNFAAQNLPTLQSHLEMIKKINETK